MNPITLYEHEFYPFDWTDHDLKMLARLNHDGSDILRPVVQQARRGLKTTQLVGVVRFGEHTFEILPKIYRSHDAKPTKNTTKSCEQQQQATRNLLFLLSYAENLDIRAEDYTLPLASQNSNWLELLTRLFATRLREVLRSSAVRRYQTLDEELPLLRGRLRIVDQSRRPERLHRFAVTTDNLTDDNPLNRLLRFVVERLWLLTRDPGNRSLLGELRERMEGVTLLPAVSAAECEHLELRHGTSRLGHDYLPLLNLARLFVKGGALQLTAGDRATCAFVLDMNALFEAFVVGFIRRNRNILLEGELRSAVLQPQAIGSSLHLAHTNGGDLFELKPDLVFRLGDSFPLLLDAKYKRLDPADAKYGISETDFYQMHAYAARCRSPRVLLIYPQTADMTTSLYRAFHLHCDREHIIAAATLDLCADLNDPAELRLLEARFRELLNPAVGSTDSAGQSRLTERMTS